MTKIHCTLFSDADHRPINKKFVRRGGETLKEKNPPKFYKGTAKHIEIDFEDLPGFLDTLEKWQCVGWGTFKGSKPGDVVKIDKKDAIANRDSANPDINEPVADADAKPRNGETFEFSEGPGVLMIDYDGPKSEHGIWRSPRDFHSLVSEHIEGFADAPVIFRRSASSRAGLVPADAKYRLYVLLGRQTDARALVARIAALPGLEPKEVDPVPVWSGGVDFAGLPHIAGGPVMHEARIGELNWGKAPLPSKPEYAVQKKESPAVTPGRIQDENIIARTKEALQYLVDNAPGFMDTEKAFTNYAWSLQEFGELGWQMLDSAAKHCAGYDAKGNRDKWDDHIGRKTAFSSGWIRAQAATAGWKDPGWITDEELKKWVSEQPLLNMSFQEVQAMMNKPVQRVSPVSGQSAPSAPVPNKNPLLNFVELGDAPHVPNWVIPGFIADGVVAIAGAHGTGKTTALVPLAMIAAGLHRLYEPLAPEHWRHIVYISEDVRQVDNIAQGFMKYGGLYLDRNELKNRFHVVDAKRVPIETVVDAIKGYRELFSRNINGVILSPLVVVDTKTAAFDIEDENDNNEISNVIGQLKQEVSDVPCWIVGHVAKPGFGETKLSMRGASSMEADVNQTLFLIQNNQGQRFLIQGKTRFAPEWQQLIIDGCYKKVKATNQFGREVEINLRWGVPKTTEGTQEETKKQKEETANADVFAAITKAYDEDKPLSKSTILEKDAVPTQTKDAIRDAIKRLTAEGKISTDIEKNGRQKTQYLVPCG